MQLKRKKKFKRGFVQQILCSNIQNKYIFYFEMKKLTIKRKKVLNFLIYSKWIFKEGKYTCDYSEDNITLIPIVFFQSQIITLYDDMEKICILTSIIVKWSIIVVKNKINILHY